MLENFKHFFVSTFSTDSFLLWSSVGAVAHTLFSPKERTILTYVVAFVTSAPIGVLAGRVAHSSFDLTFEMSCAIAVVAALVAQDLVKFILALAGFIQENRDTIFAAILKRISTGIQPASHKSQPQIEEAQPHNKDTERN